MYAAFPFVICEFCPNLVLNVFTAANWCDTSFVLFWISSYNWEVFFIRIEGDILLQYIFLTLKVLFMKSTICFTVVFRATIKECPEAIATYVSLIVYVEWCLKYISALQG